MSTVTRDRRNRKKKNGLTNASVVGLPVASDMVFAAFSFLVFLPW